MFSGYNDKISVLVGHVLEKVKGLVVDPQRLSVMKETGNISLVSLPSLLNLAISKLQLEWENFFLEKSYTISDFHARYLLSEHQWTTEEKLRNCLVSTYIQEVEHRLNINLSCYYRGYSKNI